MAFSKNTAYQEYLSFLDGGSKVPFHVRGAKYFPKPHNIDEEIELDNKQYIKSFNKYFVCTRVSTFVRQIFVSDFELVKEELRKIKEKSESVNKVQLTMDFIN